MVSAAAHVFHHDPVRAREVSRVQYESIAMEDVMQQVVENQMGHHRAVSRATWDRDGGEVHLCTSSGSVGAGAGKA